MFDSLLVLLVIVVIVLLAVQYFSLGSLRAELRDGNRAFDIMIGELRMLAEALKGSQAAPQAVSAPQSVSMAQAFAPPTMTRPLAPPAPQTAVAPSIPPAQPASPAQPAQAVIRPLTATHAQPVSPPPFASPQPQLVVGPAPMRKERSSAESVIGRNIIGIIASVLVFIGIIFLGVLVVPLLTDVVKVVAMFALSAAITAGGILLVKRSPSVFTQSLLGTGLGCFFISLLITHLVFGMLNDLATFVLLLVWLVAALFCARQTKSLIVSIVAHAGMVASVCTGYGMGLTDDRLVLLLVYQFISTALIVAGNILGCRQTYRFGLFVSLALMLYTSGAMWLAFWGIGAPFATGLPTALIVSAFLVQFVGASVLSVLLFISCLQTQERIVGMILQALNILMWGCSVLLDVTLLIGKLTMAATDATYLLYSYETLQPAIILTLLLLVAVAAGIMVLRRFRDFERDFETLTISILSGFIFFALFVNLLLLFSLVVPQAATLPRLGWFIFPALALMLVARQSYVRIYHLIAAAFLGMELICAFFIGFEEIHRFISSSMALAFPEIAASASTGGLGHSFLFGYLPALVELCWLALLLIASELCYRLLPSEIRARKQLRDRVTLACAIVFELGIVCIVVISPVFELSSFLSLAIMLVSLAVITLGFRTHARVLRIYGLVVVLCCVFKLVTIDIAGLETLMRVVAFIGGGLICFGISALYNFTVKRFEGIS